MPVRSIGTSGQVGQDITPANGQSKPAVADSTSSPAVPQDNSQIQRREDHQTKPVAVQFPAATAASATVASVPLGLAFDPEDWLKKRFKEGADWVEKRFDEGKKTVEQVLYRLGEEELKLLARIKDKGLEVLYELAEAELKVFNKLGVPLFDIVNKYKTACESIATLLSKDNPSPKELREAAAGLESIRRLIPASPPAVTLIPGLDFLNEQLRQLDNQLRHMAEDLNKLADHYEAAEKHLEANDLQAVHDDLKQIKTVLTRIRDRIPIGKDKVDKLIGKIDQLLKDVGELDGCIQAVQKHLEAGDFKAAQDALGQIKSLLTGMRERVPGGGDKIDRFLKKIDPLMEDLGKLDTYIQAAQKHLQVSPPNLREAQDNLKQVSELLKKLKKQLPELAGGDKDKLKAINERLDASVQKIDALVEDLSQLDTHFQAAMKCLEASPPDIKAAQDSLKESTILLKQIKERLPGLVPPDKVKTIIQKIDTTIGLIGLFQLTVLSQLNTRMQAVQKQLGASPPDFKAAQESLKKIKGLLSGLKGMAPKLVGGDKDKLKGINDKIDSTVEKIDALATDLGQLDTHIQAVQKHLQASPPDFKAAQDSLKKIKDLLKQLKERIPEFLGGNNDKIKELNDKIDTMLQNIDPLAEDLGALDTHLRAAQEKLAASPPDFKGAQEALNRIKILLTNIKDRLPQLLGGDKEKLKGINDKIDHILQDIGPLAEDLAELDSCSQAVHKHLAAYDLNAAQADLDRIRDILARSKGRIAVLMGGDKDKIKGINDKIDKAIQDVEERKKQITAGQKILAKLNQTRDGDILSFLKNTSDEDKKLLLYCANEQQFARIFKNASFSIIFEIIGGDDVASAIVQKAGKNLELLQPFKLGIMATYLCDGHTSDRDEKALIEIAKTLDRNELADFMRGLQEAGLGVDFAQLVEEIADQGLDRQITVEALAALYKAAAGDSAKRAEVQKYVNQLSQQNRKRFDELVAK